MKTPAKRMRRSVLGMLTLVPLALASCGEGMSEEQLLLAAQEGFNEARVGTALADVTPSTQIAVDQPYRSIPYDCGGWFRGFAAHSSGRIYGFGDVFGAFRSDDGGNSWKYLLGDIPSNEDFIYGMAVAATDADTVLFLSNGKLWKSINGGTSWVQSPPLDLVSREYATDSIGRAQGGTPVMIHPADKNEIWLANNRKNNQRGYLWRSINGGTDWSKVGGTTFDSVIPNFIYVHPNFPRQIWVGASGGLWASSDRGSNWTRVWDNGGATNPMGYAPTPHGMARRNDGTVFFASNIAGYLITFPLGAASFNPANPATYAVSAPVVTRVHGQGPISCAVLPNGDFLSVSDYEIRRSGAAGAAWTVLESKLVTPPTPVWSTPATATSKVAGGRDAILVHPLNSSRWLIAGGRSPAISTDSGATWKYPPALNGLAGVPTYGVTFPRKNANKIIVAASDQGVFTIDDGGASRKAANSARTSLDIHQTFHDVMTSDDGQTLVAAGVDQGANISLIMRSNDGGLTWTRQDLTYSRLPVNHEGIQRAVAAPGSTTDFLVLLGSDIHRPNNNPGMYRTTNGGRTFYKITDIPDGLDTGQRYNPQLSWLATDGVRTTHRYLTLARGGIHSGFWRSTNSGDNWAKPTAQPFNSSTEITGMVADPAIAGRVWVAASRAGLKSTTDGGTTWESVDHGFFSAENVGAYNGRVAVFGKRAGDTWAKIYYNTTNGRGSWVEISGPGHRYPATNHLSVDPFRTDLVWISRMSTNIIDTDINRPAPPFPSITSALTKSGEVGTQLSYSIVATNSPTRYAATNLPAGLLLNTTTGVISGVPTTQGKTNTVITVTNGSGTTSSTLVFTILARAGGLAAQSEISSLETTTSAPATSNSDPATHEASNLESK